MPLHHGCTVGCAIQLHGRVFCGPICINMSAESPVRAALQRHGRLARPPLPPVHVSAPVYNAKDNLLVCTVVQTLRPIHPSARMADSPVIDFSFTVVIINSAVDIFWLNISGEIHPLYFHIMYCFL